MLVGAVPDGTFDPSVVLAPEPASAELTPLPTALSPELTPVPALDKAEVIPLPRDDKSDVNPDISPPVPVAEDDGEAVPASLVADPVGVGSL